jgi:hypothetical protein
MIKGFLDILQSVSRGGRIRTYDLLLPKQARYRATLHPEKLVSPLFPLAEGCDHLTAATISSDHDNLSDLVCDKGK